MKLLATILVLAVLPYGSHRKQAARPAVVVAQHAEFSEQLSVAFAMVSSGDACRPLPPIDCTAMRNFLIPPNSGYCGLTNTFVILCHEMPGGGLVYFDVPSPRGPGILEFTYGVP